ncbi:hypothetical protein [Pseudomonas sp. N040]|uniref:hypothetical protein n=1 Tax=Pseudomonas sp. N040 TaxID=2785325 RepID=UPI001C616339|nr:hypothetical protein [Pseudomonas sp. N040]MBW7015042.1 hypothetical protein [Pseudomonas sp. N040]
MTLENLLGLSLEAIEPDPASIRRLLEAAQRSLSDARLVLDWLQANKAELWR